MKLFPLSILTAAIVTSSALADSGISELNLNNIQSIDSYGSSVNEHFLLGLPEGARVTGVGITECSYYAYSPSWVQDASIAIDVLDASGSPATLIFSPFGGQTYSGWSDVTTTIAFTGEDYFVPQGAVIDVEFFESYVDAYYAIEGEYFSGTFYITWTTDEVIPEDETNKLDFIGFTSSDSSGQQTNDTASLTIPAGSQITAISIEDASFYAFDLSRNSDSRIGISTDQGTVDIEPFIGQNSSGLSFYTTFDIDLTDENLIAEDGTVGLEFFEAIINSYGNIEGVF